MGSLLDARQIDEVHVFVAPKLIGGSAALGPIGGEGLAQLSAALTIEGLVVESVGEDVYVHGRTLWAGPGGLST